MFLLTAMLLGVGLAMDASAVSMANGFAEPKMKTRKVLLIAIMFGLFQGIMPLIGYFIGFTVITYIESYIPWIALLLLGFLGIRMIVQAVKCADDDQIIEDEKDTRDSTGTSKNCEGLNSNFDCKKDLTFKSIFVQAIATSIDALSVGITIADYAIIRAIICSALIAIVTFGCSFGSVFIGKKFGTKLGNKAEIFGGIVLIIIGIEIFITGII